MKKYFDAWGLNNLLSLFELCPNLLAFAGRIHKMINFALNINADDVMDAEDEEAPELEETGDNDTSTKMEDID